MPTKAYDINASPQISKLIGTATNQPGYSKELNKAKRESTPFPSPPPLGWNADEWAKVQKEDPERAKYVNDTWNSMASAETNGVWRKLPNAMDADLSRPGIGEQTVSQHLGDFFAPTNAQGFYDQGSFNAPTASEGFYQQNAGQFAKPGQAEQWFAQNQGKFNTPGAAEDFYRAHQGDLANMPDPTNRAEEAYQSSKSRRPDIDADPGLEPYYNEAEARGTRQLNKRAAAMGNYGSSVALGEVGNLVSGLEAEMANRKADYNLRRIAEQRAWEQLGGEMASSADRSSLGISQNELSQLLGMGNLAQAAQQGSLSRLLGAAGASQGAQNAQTSRLSAGSNAAAQSSSSQLGRQSLAANAASAADSQNRGNLTAGTTAAAVGQNLREGRVGGAFDRSLGLANILSSAIGQSGAAAQAADQEIIAASQTYGVAAAQNAANAADQKAARGTQVWMMAFQAGVALMPKPGK